MPYIIKSNILSSDNHITTESNLEQFWGWHRP